MVWMLVTFAYLVITSSG